MTYVYFPAVAPPLAKASSGFITAIAPINPISKVDEEEAVKNSLRDDPQLILESSRLRDELESSIFNLVDTLVFCGIVKAWLNAMTDMNMIALIMIGWTRLQMY